MKAFLPAGSFIEVIEVKKEPFFLLGYYWKCYLTHSTGDEVHCCVQKDEPWEMFTEKCVYMDEVSISCTVD